MKKFLNILLRAGLIGLSLFALGAYCGVLDASMFQMAGGGLMAIPLITGFNFAATPEQTGMVIAYKNPSLIADLVMPRVSPMKAGKLEFKWFEKALKNSFNVPDTIVGRRSRPNSVELDGTEKTDSCKAFGLETTIPVEDIENADMGEALVTQEMQALIELVLLGREARVAAMVQNSANYDAANTTTLSGTSQFQDASSNALKLIMDMLDKPIVRPNVIGMSLPVWSALRMNPSIVKATNRNSGDAGAAARQAVAELFEVDEIVIGASRINGANRGQTPVLNQCWGKHLFAHYRSKIATLKDDVVWGLTAQSGQRFTKVEEDSKVGLKGGVRVVVGEYLCEVILAKPAGILMQNVIA